MNPVILLVDADSTNREEWKSFLESQECEVYTAENGESAVSRCLQIQPDLVLLQDSLPDIRNFELCRRLKKDSLNQLTPIVLLKASPNQWDFQRAHEAGAMDVWATPSTLWDALGRVQTLLRLKNYMDEQAKSAVLSLARTIDAKQAMRNGHSERLLAYAELLGESIGLQEEDLQELRIACWLHDIGKIAVPDSILLKPGPLDAEEMRIVRQHPVIGERMCAPIKSLRRILPVIRNHHERMDGSGYPDGLRGESIPLKARILQVADIYDALTTDRPYRTALLPEDGKEVLFREAENGWIDGSLVRKFFEHCEPIERYPARSRSMLVSYFT